MLPLESDDNMVEAICTEPGPTYTERNRFEGDPKSKVLSMLGIKEEFIVLPVVP